MTGPHGVSSSLDDRATVTVHRPDDIGRLAEDNEALGELTFRRINARIDHLRTKPQITQQVRQYASERRVMNRLFDEGLVDTHTAGTLTQAQMIALWATIPRER